LLLEYQTYSPSLSSYLLYLFSSLFFAMGHGGTITPLSLSIISCHSQEISFYTPNILIFIFYFYFNPLRMQPLFATFIAYLASFPYWSSSWVLRSRTLFQANIYIYIIWLFAFLLSVQVLNYSYIFFPSTPLP
jgi:hypothetical protein